MIQTSTFKPNMISKEVRTHTHEHESKRKRLRPFLQLTFIILKKLLIFRFSFIATPSSLTINQQFDCNILFYVISHFLFIQFSISNTNWCYLASQSCPVCLCVCVSGFFYSAESAMIQFFWMGAKSDIDFKWYDKEHVRAESLSVRSSQYVNFK